MWDIPHCSIHILKNSFMIDSQSLHSYSTGETTNIKCVLKFVPCLAQIQQLWITVSQPLRARLYSVANSASTSMC